MNSHLTFDREQDEPIGDVPLVFGAEIKTALTRCTGLRYEMITKRHVAELTQEHIQDLEISDQLRRKLTSLRDYTSSLIGRTHETLSHPFDLTFQHRCYFVDHLEEYSRPK